MQQKIVAMYKNKLNVVYRKIDQIKQYLYYSFEAQINIKLFLFSVIKINFFISVEIFFWLIKYLLKLVTFLVKIA